MKTLVLSSFRAALTLIVVKVHRRFILPEIRRRRSGHGRAVIIPGADAC
jgi:hypothetical protein